MTWSVLLERSSQQIQIHDSLYVFESEKSIFDIIFKLPYLGDLKNPGQLPVQEALGETDNWVLLNFIISLISIYLFEINESIAEIPTELGDLENLGQPPV